MWMMADHHIICTCCRSCCCCCCCCCCWSFFKLGFVGVGLEGNFCLSLVSDVHCPVSLWKVGHADTEWTGTPTSWGQWDIWLHLKGSLQALMDIWYFGHCSGHFQHISQKTCTHATNILYGASTGTKHARGMAISARGVASTARGVAISASTL